MSEMLRIRGKGHSDVYTEEKQGEKDTIVANLRGCERFYKIGKVIA